MQVVRQWFQRWKQEETQVEATRQAAHDLRAPLSAMALALGTLPAEVPDPHRQILLQAFQRIREITDDLLMERLSPRPTAGAELNEVVARVFKEKRALFPKIAWNLELDFSPRSNWLSEPKILLRILSNLLDNAVEAGARHITLRIRDGGDVLLAQIVDDGCGIRAEDLVELGRKGCSIGKCGLGNGLGLFHARSTIRAWGGDLKILSRAGHGTSVEFHLCART